MGKKHKDMNLSNSEFGVNKNKTQERNRKEDADPGFVQNKLGIYIHRATGNVNFLSISIIITKLEC